MTASPAPFPTLTSLILAGITDAGPPVPPFAHTVHVTRATNPMVTPRRYGWHAADRLSLGTGRVDAAGPGHV